MSRTRFGVQAAILVTVVAFVSWPQFRPVHAQTIWIYAPSTAQQLRAGDATRLSDPDRTRSARLNAASASSISGAPTPSDRSRGSSSDGDHPAGFVTPGTVAALGGKLNALVGFARTSLNVPVPFARVILRNLRTGQVQRRTTADEHGRFSFLDLGANWYVAELLGPDGSVIAASEMIVMAAGDVRQTELRTAASASSIVASFGNTLTGTLPQATTAAADSDVTRTTPTLLAQESAR